MIRNELQRANTDWGIDPLDAEILLAHALGKDRVFLLSHPDSSLSPTEKKKIEVLLKRRKSHEPIAYIIGEKEFYGRTFKVDSRVLIPRPSTETLIDALKKLYTSFPSIDVWFKPQYAQADTGIVILIELFRNVHAPPEFIVDIGTGSGCIGITLALEIPEIKVICTDISSDALCVARENARSHGVLDRIIIEKANLLKTNNYQLKTNNFFVVSNPPYIPERELLPPDVQDFEPSNALFAGPDGMSVILKLYNQCKMHPQCIGCMIEMRLDQAKKIQGTL